MIPPLRSGAAAPGRGRRRAALALAGVALAALVLVVAERVAALTSAAQAADTAAGAGDTSRAPDGFRLATPPYTFQFPRDHAAHPAYRTEWWYYTGHLRAGTRTWGYELTFFAVGLDRAGRARASAWAPHTVYLAHLAVTDEAGQRFQFEERAGRPGLGLAGADSAHYRVWIDDWSASLGPDGTTHHLSARAERFALALDLAPRTPPAIHGANGVSRKAAGPGHASHYYSLTRLETRGTLTLEGHAVPVTGVSWMDHEFGSGPLGADQVGWDWFGLQLDDGRALMLYVLRLKDGGVEPLSSGTWIARDGGTRHLPRSAFTVEPLGTWTSPASGGRYPSGWRVRVPEEGLDVRVSPTVRDQELRTVVTGVTYWEGSVRVVGRDRRGPVRGVGYAELTGYAGRPIEF